MPSVEEMAAWTLDEIKVHIQLILPKGHQFVFGRRQAADSLAPWAARFEDSDGKGLWEQSGMDERVLLLDAFGWLWRQQQPAAAPGTPWAQKEGLRQQHIVRRPSNDPEPEDLDPAEVLAVYGLGPKET
jgi:hypothetical protein